MTTKFLFRLPAQTLAISGSDTASAPVGLPSRSTTLRFNNEGPDHCYVAVSTAPVPATLPAAVGKSTCLPIMSGEDVVFSVSPSSPHWLSIICRSGKTCILDVTTSEGL